MPKNLYFWAAVVLVIGLSVVLVRKAAQQAKDKQRAEEIASGKGGGEFNPRPYSDALFLDCYQNKTCDTALYSDLLKLSDEQIRSIFLDWHNRYKNKQENENRTLAQAIRYAYSGWFAVGWNWVKPVVDRLVSLGLE